MCCGSDKDHGPPGRNRCSLEWMCLSLGRGELWERRETCPTNAWGKASRSGERPGPGLVPTGPASGGWRFQPQRRWEQSSEERGWDSGSRPPGWKARVPTGPWLPVPQGIKLSCGSPSRSLDIKFFPADEFARICRSLWSLRGTSVWSLCSQQVRSVPGGAGGLEAAESSAHPAGTCTHTRTGRVMCPQLHPTHRLRSSLTRDAPLFPLPWVIGGLHWHQEILPEATAEWSLSHRRRKGGGSEGSTEGRRGSATVK